MAPVQNKIPAFNDEFDLRLIYMVFKKNLPYIFIIFAFSFAVAFLYLRYTHTLYRAESIIQIHTEEEARLVFDNRFTRVDLQKKIEVLSSKMFLQRVFDKLPLEISYFKKGRFLHTEMYRNNPYTVHYNVKNASIYGKQINIDFLPNGRFVINYQQEDNTNAEYEFSLLDTARLPYVDLYVTLHNPSLIRRQSFLDKEEYFFVINNPKNIVEDYSHGLKIFILNNEAQSIKVSFTGRHPVKVTDIVNTIAQEFNLYDVEKQAESTERILAYIDEQLLSFNEKLYETKHEIDQFKKERNIGVFVQPLQEIYTRIAEFEDNIQKQDFEILKLESVSNLILNRDDLDVYEVYAMIQGSEVQALVAANLLNIQNLLMQREELLYNVTANNAQIKQIQYKIDIQKRLLAESINIALKNAKVTKQELGANLKEFKKIIQPAINDQNIGELSILQQIHKTNETFYNQLLEKKAQYTINRAGFVSQNVILKGATVPDEHVSPVESTIYLIALFASIIMSFVLLALKYLIYNEILSPRDITRLTDIPLLGIVPKFTKKIPVNQIIINENPKSLIAESLRAIRTNLQFINDVNGPKVLTLTSTVSGEGKTFIAFNLACIIAFSFKKVIVIDMDMRKPKIHMGFNIENKRGTSTILSGIDDIEECIHQSHVENLDFITAGPIPPNPAELIQTENFDKMISHLKKKYDFIIIDNAPIGIVIDAMRSIQMADFPIYVMRAQYSKKMFINNIERLKTEGKIKYLSLILNDVDIKFSKYGLQSYAYDNTYGYGYGYGYGYYEEESELEKEDTFWKRLKNLFFENGN